MPTPIFLRSASALVVLMSATSAWPADRLDAPLEADAPVSAGSQPEASFSASEVAYTDTLVVETGNASDVPEPADEASLLAADADPLEAVVQGVANHRAEGNEDAALSVVGHASEPPEIKTETVPSHPRDFPLSEQSEPAESDADADAPLPEMQSSEACISPTPSGEASSDQPLPEAPAAPDSNTSVPPDASPTAEASAAVPVFSMATITPEITALDSEARSILFVGGRRLGDNCGIADFIDGFAHAEGIELQTGMAVVASGGIDWLDLDRLLDPPGESWRSVYEKDEEARIFNVVVLEADAEALLDDERSEDAVSWLRMQAETVRNQGAEPVVLMTWAPQADHDADRRLADASIQAANDIGALCIPAGIAFAKARAEHPEVRLLMPDGKRPTAAGSYLAAATAFSAIAMRPLEGSAYRGGCEKPLDEQTARVLQRTAWEVVKTFYDWF